MKRLTIILILGLAWPFSASLAKGRVAAGITYKLENRAGHVNHGCNGVICLLGVLHNHKKRPSLSSKYDFAVLVAEIEEIPLSHAEDIMEVFVRETVSLEQLSIDLIIDPLQLISLNNVDGEHFFQRGDWVALPIRVRDKLDQASSLDPLFQRKNVVSNVNRQPMDLIQKNEPRVRVLLGFREPVSRKHLISGGNTLSPAEQQILHRIRSNSQQQWRAFGSCYYDWSSWKLHQAGVRTTASKCSNLQTTIAVSCSDLKVTRLYSSGWEKWRRPTTAVDSPTSGEDLMVAALCANILNTLHLDESARKPIRLPSDF